jgi:hypothetical protein
MMKEHRKSVMGFLALRLPLISTVVILLTIFAIVGNFLIIGVPHLTWSFFTDPPTNANTSGGIYPAIVGTAALVLLMTLAAVPVGRSPPSTSPNMRGRPRGSRARSASRSIRWRVFRLWCSGSSASASSSRRSAARSTRRAGTSG